MFCNFGRVWTIPWSWCTFHPEKLQSSACSGPYLPSWNGVRVCWKWNVVYLWHHFYQQMTNQELSRSLDHGLPARSRFCWKFKHFFLHVIFCSFQVYLPLVSALSVLESLVLGEIWFSLNFMLIEELDLPPASCSVRFQTWFIVDQWCWRKVSRKYLKTSVQNSNVDCFLLCFFTHKIVPPDGQNIANEIALIYIII